VQVLDLAVLSEAVVHVLLRRLFVDVGDENDPALDGCADVRRNKRGRGRDGGDAQRMARVSESRASTLSKVCSEPTPASWRPACVRAAAPVGKKGMGKQARTYRPGFGSRGRACGGARLRLRLRMEDEDAGSGLGVSVRTVIDVHLVVGHGGSVDEERAGGVRACVRARACRRGFLLITAGHNRAEGTVDSHRRRARSKTRRRLRAYDTVHVTRLGPRSAPATRMARC
jgi:hypothetical protein